LNIKEHQKLRNFRKKAPESAHPQVYPGMTSHLTEIAEE